MPQSDLSHSNKPEFVKEIQKSFVGLGSYNSVQCQAIAHALITIFFDALRRRYLDTVSDHRSYQELDLADKIDLNEHIRIYFLNTPELRKCAIQELILRREELNINSLPALLAEGLAHAAYRSKLTDDPETERVVKALFFEEGSLGMSEQTAIETLVNEAADAFPGMKNEILHEFGMRMQAKEAELQLRRQQRSELSSRK